MVRNTLKKAAFFFFTLFQITVSGAAALSPVDEDRRNFRMYYRDEELKVLSSARQPQVLSRLSENVYVVYAAEIESMNAHTLADVLQGVPGVAIDYRGGPGGGGLVFIQGSDYRHVLLMIDEVPMNNLGSFAFDPSMYPVQNIDRVEIIKGPAAAAWGSSLGGVISVYTKLAGGYNPLEAFAYASNGEKGTGDYRAELFGKEEGYGWYLNFSKLRTDGLTPNTPYDSENFYAKLEGEITEKTSYTFNLGYNDVIKGEGEYAPLDLAFDKNFDYLYSTLEVHTNFKPRLGLTLSLRTLRQNLDSVYRQKSTGSEAQRTREEDSNFGGTAQVRWLTGKHSFTLGMDADTGTTESTSFPRGEAGLTKYAFFFNDVYFMNDLFFFTPGIRYDHTSTNGGFLSPSFGVTARAAEKITLRATMARGFNTPPLGTTYGRGYFYLPNPGLTMEKVWSYQAGVETNGFRYLWFKAGVFRHDVSDALASEAVSPGLFTMVNKSSQRRQGFEAEVRTHSIRDFSFFAGAAYVDGKDRETGLELQDIARWTVDLSFLWAPKGGVSRAELKGHYIRWNVPAAYEAQCGDFIWDLHLSHKVWKRTSRNVELFLSGHNLFNSSQYFRSAFPNAGRWVEGGIRASY